AWSPASIAWRTRLIEVRSIERRLELCLLRATAWRARLRACAVLAMVSGKKRKVKAKPTILALYRIKGKNFRVRQWQCRPASSELSCLSYRMIVRDVARYR